MPDNAATRTLSQCVCVCVCVFADCAMRILHCGNNGDNVSMFDFVMRLGTESRNVTTQRSDDLWCFKHWRGGGLSSLFNKWGSWLLLRTSLEHFYTNYTAPHKLIIKYFLMNFSLWLWWVFHAHSNRNIYKRKRKYLPNISPASDNIHIE